MAKIVKQKWCYGIIQAAMSRGSLQGHAKLQKPWRCCSKAKFIIIIQKLSKKRPLPEVLFEIFFELKHTLIFIFAGMHVWHQDYGYWYNFGCLFPNMGTVSIAIERASKENGCLQILEKSHKFGRVNHMRIGDQAGIDDETMQYLLKKCKLRHVELGPGDAIFFHCNLIHKSNQNSSPFGRMAFLIAYNRADNDPVIKHHHSQYTKLDIVENDQILLSNAHSFNKDKEFFKLKDDIGINKLSEE